MGRMLTLLGKKSTVALPDKMPSLYRFLPGSEYIVGPDTVGSDYDLIVCLDSSSPDRMGKVYRPTEHGSIPLIVIDHHITNTRFGTINWVMPDCAAACQMVLYLAHELAVPLDSDLALCLLTGVVTDTLCFRTSNTNADVMRAAVKLMEAGADLSYVTELTLNRKPFVVLRSWGEILPNVVLDQGVAWVAISQRDLAGANPAHVDLQLSSLLIATDEADVSGTFTEDRDGNGGPVVECSFRAKPGFDVSALALSLGGGGHPPASGCTLPGTLDSVTASVVPLLKELRRNQTRAGSDRDQTG
jgi:phosphoesterase RecJ-like protein